MKARISRLNWFLFLGILFFCLPAFAQSKADIKLQNQPKALDLKPSGTAAAPDLVVSNIDVSPASPESDSPITVKTFVKNIGAMDAPPATLHLQIGGKVYPPIAVPALPATKEWRQTTEVGTLKAGPYQITATVNQQNQIGEKRTDNNTTVKTFTVKQAIAVIIKNVIWNRASMTWVATVENSTPAPAPVAVVGFPLENGVPGMTKWANTTLPGHGTFSLSGDYSSFSVPAGTRLKVHVKKENSDVLLDEKIIVLD